MTVSRRPPSREQRRLRHVAVIALLRGEPGATLVAHHLGHAAMSAVNLQELVKAPILRGLTIPVIGDMVQESRPDLHAHDRDAAFAAARLTDATRLHGSGLGDRTCMALAIKLGVPVLTADRSRGKLTIPGLTVEIIH